MVGFSPKEIKFSLLSIKVIRCWEELMRKFKNKKEIYPFSTFRNRKGPTFIIWEKKKTGKEVELPYFLIRLL